MCWAKQHYWQRQQPYLEVSNFAMYHSMMDAAKMYWAHNDYDMSGLNLEVYHNKFSKGTMQQTTHSSFEDAYITLASLPSMMKEYHVTMTSNRLLQWFEMEYMCTKLHRKLTYRWFGFKHHPAHEICETKPSDEKRKVNNIKKRYQRNQTDKYFFNAARQKEISMEEEPQRGAGLHKKMTE
jgi:hypothetical protein